jgi:hypothetical protein
MTVKDPTELTTIAAWKKPAACYNSYVDASTLTVMVAVASRPAEIVVYMAVPVYIILYTDASTAVHTASCTDYTPAHIIGRVIAYLSLSTAGSTCLLSEIQSLTVYICLH